MYMLRINYSGAPLLFEVEIDKDTATITKELSNYFKKRYESVQEFKKQWLISSTTNIPKTTDFGHLLYSQDLAILQALIIKYVFNDLKIT